jgi:AraC-like DNA-binding protein
MPDGPISFMGKRATSSSACTAACHSGGLCSAFGIRAAPGARRTAAAESRWRLRDERLNVDQLAERVGMSPRNFARSYKAETGRTPAKAIEVFRLEAARRLLEETEQGVDRIARRCGFGDEERMRTTFQRHLAISPRDYRRRFSTRSVTPQKRSPV